MRPPHRKRSEWGRASGSEGVWFAGWQHADQRAENQNVGGMSWDDECFLNPGIVFLAGVGECQFVDLLSGIGCDDDRLLLVDLREPDSFSIDGDIDAQETARAPSTFYSHPDRVKRLFPDFHTVERDYYRKTRIFPIMHTFVIRRELYEANPWIAQSLYKAFVQAQRITYDSLRETAALKTMLPWLGAHVDDLVADFGPDWWAYGLEPNRHVLETFLRHHHRQGLSKRLLKPEDLFAPETFEAFKI